MKRFIVFPENCKSFEFGAPDWFKCETLFRGICSDYTPRKRVCIIDTETNEYGVFQNVIDKNGNNVRIEKIA